VILELLRESLGRRAPSASPRMAEGDQGGHRGDHDRGWSRLYERQANGTLLFPAIINVNDLGHQVEVRQHLRLVVTL